MIASLPMYDLPVMREATDAFWAGLARTLRAHDLPEVPDQLDRAMPIDAQWRSEDLLLSQTCGYPLVHSFSDTLQVVATPHYAAEGCSGPRYCSAVIVRRADPASSIADLRHRRCAINGWQSHSGMNALRAHVAAVAEGDRFFAEIVETGGHSASVEAVSEDKADVAAIDCVTFSLLCRHKPEVLRRVRVLEWTASAPGLPLVTATARDERELVALRAALRDAIADPALATARETLLLTGVSVLADDAYGEIGQFEERAAALGYAELV
ncbi:MAG: PhnD/SsuA/transferrin family substrate-binding protein [Alphaproteobacteria bacterium]|nr:PhnD/SsuA/transferrin family substrate-binding protein [Alphaproteobacteria bacterium]